MDDLRDQPASIAPRRSLWTGAGWAILVLLVAVAALFAHKLASPATPPSWVYEVDLRGYFFPSLTYAGRQLAQGTIPLWAPGQLLGVPFAAALQPAVFYPLLLPFVLLLKTEHALIAHAATHLVLAGLFSWIYLRTIGLGWISSMLGALAYMLSPEITHSLYNTAFLSNRIWLPALFAAIHLLVERPTRGHVVILATVTTMLFLSGSAQGAVYSLQVGAIYSIALLAVSSRESRRLPTAMCLIGGVALGLGLAAVQLGPTLELASEGVRSLHGVNVLRAGGLGDTESVGAGALATGVLRQIGGLAGVLLSLAAVLHRPRRGLVAFFLVMLVVSCDFQRGNDGFVFPFYFALPAGNLFTLPSRIDYVSSFAAACLVGVGMESAVGAFRRLPRPVLTVLTGMVAVAVLWPRYSDDRTPRAWPPIVDASRMYGESAIVETAKPAMGHDRLFVYQHPETQRIPPRSGLLYDFHVLYDYEPLLPGSYSRFFSINPEVRWRGRLNPVAGATTAKGASFDVSMRVLDSLAVRHYLYAREKSGVAARIVERATALPRAYAVDRVTYAGSDEAALASVHADGFDPVRQVVLTSTVKLLEESTDALESEVRFARDREDEVVLDASCTKPCVVVLSDLAYPGWEAELDGRPAELVKANYLLRAVAMPAGQHEIRYVYRPRAFAVGAAISALSALSLLAMALGRRRSR